MMLYSLLFPQEAEVRERGAKCRALEKEVKNKCLTCQTLVSLGRQQCFLYMFKIEP